MTTIKINKDNFWKKMSIIYKMLLAEWELEIKLKKEKDPTVRLNKLVNDPDNTVYWPFDNVEKFLNHLHSNNDY